MAVFSAIGFRKMKSLSRLVQSADGSKGDDSMATRTVAGTALTIAIPVFTVVNSSIAACAMVAAARVVTGYASIIPD
jgi:hypothetical protein